MLTGCGLAAVCGGLIATWRFSRRGARVAALPAVSVLRPLCGAEPGLEAALASICLQAGPGVQMVFGVQDPEDPAIGVVARLRARFPKLDLTLVVDSTGHGANRKIGNLLNMLPRARHDLLVFCDSDLHVAPDYLDRVIAALGVPGVGLVTTVCTGLPVVNGLAARLGATAISHSFVPGALLSRELGRQDCLGTTMALTRATLDAIGGLATVRDHLADDNVLGQLVRRLGLEVTLAPTVPRTAVTETTLGALWRHEMRWARTIRALEPCLFALTMVQYPIFWAFVALLLHPARGTAALFLLAWGVRWAACALVDRALQPGLARASAAGWLLPLRDALSVVQVASSYLGSSVVWRGHVLRADAGRPVWN